MLDHAGSRDITSEKHDNDTQHEVDYLIGSRNDGDDSVTESDVDPRKTNYVIKDYGDDGTAKCDNSVGGQDFVAENYDDDETT